MKKSIDIFLGVLFIILTIIFITLVLNNDNFFHWVFKRHQNQLSWYIRPLFIIPFSYFSYKKNFTGIGITIFALFTSMFWFPIPKNVNIKVQEFLTMEKEYLKGSWNIIRIIFTLLIPFLFSILSYAFWKRNIKCGIFVIIFMAFSKIFWSLMEGGKSGFSIIFPAILGLLICILFVIIGLRSSNKV